MALEQSAVRKMTFGISWKLMMAIAFPIIFCVIFITSISVSQFARDKVKYVLYLLHLSTNQICKKATAAIGAGQEPVGVLSKEYENLEFSNNYFMSIADSKLLIGDSTLMNEPDFKKWLARVTANPLFEGASQEKWGKEEYIVSYCRIASNNHTFLSLHLVPKIKALKPIHQMARTIIYIALGLLGFSALISVYLARSFSKPIQILADASDEIAAGNFQFQWKVGNGDEIGILSDHLDILKTRLRDREIQLGKVSQLANMDHLTRLWNRRFLEESVDKLFSVAKRHNRPLSAVYFDLDHFKKINDTYGHDAGDVVLQRVGELLRNSIRKTDLAARMGGEEFLVILQETDAAGALKFAEIFRNTLKASPLFVADDRTEIRVTASIGISSRVEDGLENPKDLVTVADQYAYKSKHGGRDRISHRLGQAA
jgi:diguanylate cyclase (GGDEF)-like protein